MESPSPSPTIKLRFIKAVSPIRAETMRRTLIGCFPSHHCSPSQASPSVEIRHPIPATDRAPEIHPGVCRKTSSNMPFLIALDHTQLVHKTVTIVDRKKDDSIRGTSRRARVYGLCSVPERLRRRSFPIVHFISAARTDTCCGDPLAGVRGPGGDPKHSGDELVIIKRGVFSLKCRTIRSTRRAR
jgi:hypothetical protein